MSAGPKSHVTFWLVATVLVVSAARVAYLQEVSSAGRVFGVVIDELGGAVPHARVAIRARMTGETRSAIADDFGRYVVNDVPAGLHELRATKEGFRPSVSDIGLVAGASFNVNPRLRVGGVTERVTVTPRSEPARSSARGSEDDRERRLREQVAARPDDHSAYLELAELYYTQERFGESAHAMELASVLWAADRRAKREPSAEIAAADGIRPPRAVMRMTPIYPDAARSAGFDGVVIVQTTITEDGTVTDVRVLRGAPMLDDAAVGAVRLGLYEPVRLNGIPVAVDATTTVTFALN